MKKITLIIIICLLSFNLIFSQVENPFLRGISQLQAEEYTSAISSFSKAIENNTYTQKSFFYKGIALTQILEFSEAEESFTKAKTLGNLEADLWIAKLHAQNNDPILTVKYLKQYILEYDNYNTREIIKDKAFQKIHHTHEWQDFVLNIEVSPIEELFTHLSYLEKKEQYTKGIDLLNSALIEYNQASELLYYRAKFHIINNNIPLAYLDIKAATSKEPENRKFLALLAHIYLLDSKYVNAIEVYTRLIELSPEDLDLQLKLANTYNYANQSENARNSLNTYLNYMPENIDALYLSAEIFYNQKQFTKSIRELNELMENNNPIAEWFLKRGLCFMQTKTYKSASEDLSMCLDLDPSNTAANLQLGIAHQRLGNKSKACFYWERALQFGELEATEFILKHCD